MPGIGLADDINMTNSISQTGLSFQLEQSIYLIRKNKVMLDSELAALYGVTTKRLNEQVRRNIRRFPSDFAFQLTIEEDAHLRSQIATSKTNQGGRRYRPYVFTEQGIAMLSSVLNSERAIDMNIEIMRTFVKLRLWLSSNKEFAHKLATLENKYDHQFKVVFDAIREIMASPSKNKNRIGFEIKKT